MLRTEVRPTVQSCALESAACYVSTFFIDLSAVSNYLRETLCPTAFKGPNVICSAVVADRFCFVRAQFNGNNI